MKSPAKDVCSEKDRHASEADAYAAASRSSSLPWGAPEEGRCKHYERRYQGLWLDVHPVPFERPNPYQSIQSSVVSCASTPLSPLPTAV